MQRLEEKAITIQTCMHNTVTHTFDRVSDNSNNGTTPLQEQQDKQPEAVIAENKAIDNNEYDLLTEYSPWSTKTHDMYDCANDIYDTNRKDTCDEICPDTPVKIIDTYNKDRAQINQSLSDTLGLGQNSLLGAQQVIVATKHNDQMTEVLDHLRHLSLSEQIEATECHRKHRKVNIISQVDGIVDSTDSLHQTPNSVDLTVSPVKHKNPKVDKGNKNRGANDEDND